MAVTGNESFVTEGMAPPQRILFPPERIYMDWQQRWRAGAGLHNPGNLCFLNSILQCLTYTPPLANYLLSREHSQSCRQRGFCVMCRMESHVNRVLRSSGSAIYPSAVISVLSLIGEHFQLGMQEDAHEFLRYTVDAMQRACLNGIGNLDISSESTTIVHQIFGGFLRSRVTCSSCKAVSDSYEAFLDIPLDIKAASSVTAALADFVTPEQLDGENCFKCSQCNKMVAASKRFTVHRVPRVLTVCLKRFEDFTGRKINKVVKYSSCLDLRPYMSQPDGESLSYSLYAVLVHSGNGCHSGHYFCYIKASNGLWYEMNDSSVDLCDISTVLQQQAYLLFYVRSSDLRGGRPSSPQIPSHACAFLSQWAAGSEQPSGRSSSGTQPGFPICSQPLDLRLHAVRRDEEEEDGFSSSSCCQRNGVRERAWSSLPQRDEGFCSCFAVAEDNYSARRPGPSREQAFWDDSRPWTSDASSWWAPASWAAAEHTILRERERSRSPRCGYNLRSRFVEFTDDRGSAKRRRTSPPRHKRTPRDDLPPWISSSMWDPASRAAWEQTQLRERERSRSPQRDYNLWSRFMDYRDDRGSAKRRRISPPRHKRTPRDDLPPWISSSMWDPASRAAWEQSQLRERERSRSLQQDYDLWSRFTEYRDNHGSARRRTSPPSQEQAPRDDLTPWTSSSKWDPASRAASEQTQLRERERSRSPPRGYNLRSRFVEYTDHHRSARGGGGARRRPPRRKRVARDDAAPGSSSARSKRAPAPRAAQDRILPRRRE
ncbi:uncharacterized protein LOC142025885 [Buteo buteo]|uniref:uncharacterized protein LOC142025885 n=1 Tax=Buteo buteo TaxID=30397 RepID=UPI003EB7F2DD